MSFIILETEDDMHGLASIIDSKDACPEASNEANSAWPVQFTSVNK
jgi:hypothetical protein